MHSPLLITQEQSETIRNNQERPLYMRLRYFFGTFYLAYTAAYIDPRLILPTAIVLGIGYGLIDNIRERNQR